MRKLFLTVTIPAILLSLVSCKSADKNFGNIAEDMCNCYKGLEAKMSDDTKKIVSNAANAADPTKSVQDDLMALGEEKAQQIGQEMQSIGEIEDESSEISRCMKELEKKYKNTYSLKESKTLQKILKELKGRAGCGFTASLLKMGLKMKDKTGPE